MTLPDLELWGNTTDPRSYAPDYRYLVHGFNPRARENALRAATLDAKQGIEYDPAWGDQTIDLRHAPERLAGRVSLSMTLIDPTHRRTYGHVGLIVAAPEQNVVYTSPKMGGTHNGNRKALLEYAAHHPIMSGDALLDMANPADCNEVVALADHQGQQIQLQGFFYKATEGMPHDYGLTQLMILHAKRLGKPIIEIATT